MIFYHDSTSLLVLSLMSAVLAAPIYNNNGTNATLNGSPSPSVAGFPLNSSSPPCPNDAGMFPNSSCMPGTTGAPLSRANGMPSSGLSSNKTKRDSLSTTSSTSPSTGSSGSPPSPSTTPLLPRDGHSDILLSRAEPLSPKERGKIWEQGLEKVRRIIKFCQALEPQAEQIPKLEALRKKLIPAAERRMGASLTERINILIEVERLRSIVLALVLKTEETLEEAGPGTQGMKLLNSWDQREGDIWLHLDELVALQKTLQKTTGTI